MDRFPVEPRKRKIVEMLIRIIDIVIYFVVFMGGVYALFFTPNTIKTELAGWEWLVPWWAGFLLVGGLLGLVGRISTIWIIEPAASFAAGTGTLIYLVVIGRTSLTSITAAVATCLIAGAFLGIVRRYLELQLFGSDPTHRDFKSRARDAWERRIPDVPPRG